MTRAPLLAALASIALASGILASCAAPPCGEERAVVSAVVDGDTIELEDGRKVRYLSVDSPEITKGRDDCWGREAADYNAALVGGREVTLRFDAGAAENPALCTDKYGRLLAYVSVGGVEVNSRLVAEGYACAYDFPPAGQSRAAEFADLELAARNTRQKLWSCAVVTCLH